MGADNGQRITQTAAERRKRAHGARLERVSWGAEPPARVWPVKALVPQGPRPRWRLRRHLVPLEREERGYVTTVIGSGGTGKSYLLVDLAIALLTGGRWLGKRVLPLRSVLYVDAELDVDTMRERGWQVAPREGAVPAAGPRPLVALAQGVGCAPGGCTTSAYPSPWPRTRGCAGGARAKACRAELILFDSLTIGSAGAGLADQNAWNRVLSGMEAWGVPCVVIDHMGKTEGRGAVGSFMKQAKVRSALELERKPDGTIVCEHAKSNFGPMLPAWRIRPVFEHCDPDDPAAAAGALRRRGRGRATRWSPTPTERRAPGRADPPEGAHVGQAGAGGYWTPGAPGGGAGAVPREIADELAPVLGDPRLQVRLDAVKKLEAGRPW